MTSQQFGLDGKVALVTGANTGLGQAMAVALARAGASVALVGRSEPDETEALIKSAGGETAVVMADLLAEKADFFSIGTTDLIQFSLAIDRGNRQVAHLYQPLDPAIIRMIKQVADVSRDKGIEVFMCGEMAATPHHIPLLLGIGLDELSMNPQSIPQVKRTIRSLSVSDARSFAQEALKKKTARGVFELLQETYGDTMAQKVSR